MLSIWREIHAGERYDPNRKTADFRRYDEAAPEGVREFYRLNHTFQTREFARDKKRQYGARIGARWVSGKPSNT